MRNFIISTDNNSDLPVDYCKENNIDVHSLYYTFNDNEIYGNEKQLDPSVFYARMRNGEMPSTMATNPEDSKTAFEKILKQGFDIIHLSFSSALSSTYQNTCIAAEELLEEYKDSKITVIDSLSASMGQGLLVYKTMEYAKQGHSYDEVVSFAENVKGSISHQFTVDDLFHLHRGGRVSRTAAIVGTLIGVKPILHVNDLGQLIPIGKTRGRKKSLMELVDTMFATMGSHDNSTVMLSHGDSLLDAQYVVSLIHEKLPDTNVILNNICPTIGAHSGPGTIALFFEADKR